MCTFDIVPSLGPQSQVLHPAEVSVFVQSSIPSTRSAIHTHHKYRLHYYTSTMFPRERSSTRHRCPSPNYRSCSGSRPTHNPRLPIRRSGKGSARPRYNLITNSHICGGKLPASKDYHIIYSHTPNLTHSSNSIQQFMSKYGNQGIR